MHILGLADHQCPTSTVELSLVAPELQVAARDTYKTGPAGTTPSRHFSLLFLINFGYDHRNSQ